MSHDPSQRRLAEITTCWSAVYQAHQGPAPGVPEARGELLRWYEGAVRRYLLTALRDRDTVDELFQEFALRFCRGDFHRASPEQGRFRDFLSRALMNLVMDHRREQAARRRRQSPQRAEPAIEVPPEEQLAEAFQRSWREELLHRTWDRLAAIPTRTAQQWYTVLRLKAEHPDWRSPQLAEHLSQQEGKPVATTTARQILHRARDRFAELLLEEVARSLAHPTRAQIEEELADLGLLAFCQGRLGPNPPQKQG